jgi:hypothetical protein
MENSAVDFALRCVVLGGIAWMVGAVLSMLVLDASKQPVLWLFAPPLIGGLVLLCALMFTGG